MRFLYTTRLAILSSSLLLTACPSLPPTPQTDVSHNTLEWLQHKEQLETLVQQPYQARGTFGYISPEQNGSARFLWQQKKTDEYRLLLTSSFGGKVAELNVEPNFTQLTNDKNESIAGYDAERLLQDILNVNVPLDNLKLWLVGLPGDNTHYSVGQDFNLREVKHTRNGLNWIVNYKSYHSKYTPPLPRELELKQGEQRIKLKIDNWTITQ